MTNVASARARHTTTTTRDTATRRARRFENVSSSRTFRRTFEAVHSCMHAMVCEYCPPAGGAAHLACRAGVRLPPCNSACPGRQLISAYSLETTGDTNMELKPHELGADPTSHCAYFSWFVGRFRSAARSAALGAVKEVPLLR